MLEIVCPIQTESLFEKPDRFMRRKASLQHENTWQCLGDKVLCAATLLLPQDQPLVCNVLLLLLEILGPSSNVKLLTVR